MMAYFIVSNLALAVFFIIYCYGLRNLTFFHWNRFYLLASLLLANVLPLLLFLKEPIAGQFVTVMPDLNLNLHQSDVAVAEGQSQHLHFGVWLYSAYWIGLIVASLWFVMRVLAIWYRKPNAKESYSFFSKMVLSSHLTFREQTVISAHEREHQKMGHSYDLLLLEVWNIVQWFNPLYYFLRKELKFLHECQVDAKQGEDKVAYAELLLSQAFNTNIMHMQHSFSSQSQLKNRMKMLFNEKSNPYMKMVYAISLPFLLTFVTLVFSINGSMAQSKKSFEQVQEKEELKPADQQQWVEQPEVLALYPGGFDTFRMFVMKNLEYTQEAIDAGVRGRMEVSFLVDLDGKPKDFKVVRDDLGHGMSDALIKSIQTAETWKPAIHNGKKVASKILIPVNVDLSKM